MRRRELSEKLERHMERGEEEMRLNRAAFDRNTQAFERLMAAFDRHEQAFERVTTTLDGQETRVDDLKVFIRDMNRRSEKVVQGLVRGNREFCRELTAKTESKTNAILAALKDAREESRAQRQALLALIDRSPPSQAA